MVAIPATVRIFGQRPVECNARALLFRAHADLERGEPIAAGCRLREAIKQYLIAECTYWDCLPKPKRKRRVPPLEYAKALQKHDQCGELCFDVIDELLSIGNALAHLDHVSVRQLESAISWAHALLDGSPYLQQPVAAGRLEGGAV